MIKHLNKCAKFQIEENDLSAVVFNGFEWLHHTVTLGIICAFAVGFVLVKLQFTVVV